MTDVTIRMYKDGDESTLSTLIRRVLKEVNTDDPKWENDWLYEHYTPEVIADFAKTSHVYVLERNGEIVGTGAIRWDEELTKKRQNKHAEIFACFIHADHIKEGLGGQLFDALENDEIFKEADRIWLTTSVMARGFYEHRGYHYTFGYLGKNDDDLVEMDKTKRN